MAAKDETFPPVVVRFLDGPRADEEFRCVNPPSRVLRFAFPEWCTYERVGETLTYRYMGDVRIERDGLFGEDRIAAVS